MGQRSQIYVGFGDKGIIARYFQDNCLDDMISRARNAMEWLKCNATYLGMNEKQLQLIGMLEANFDKKYVSLSDDIVQEWKEYGEGYSFGDYVFKGQDNNNGQLYIDVDLDGNIKYAFVHQDEMCKLDYSNVLNAREYIAKECETVYPEFMNRIKADSEENIKWIEENATLMTAEDLAIFLECDYGYIHPMLETEKQKNPLTQKQPTYLVTAETEKEKLSFADSSLCMVRDWEMGWFDVPYSMLDEFERCFGKAGPENNACSKDITKEDIQAYNLHRVPQRAKPSLDEKMVTAKDNIEKTSQSEARPYENTVLR